MQLLPLTDLYMNRETLDTMQKAVVVLFKKTHKAGQRHVTHGLSMRDKDNFILCCSLQRFMGAIWYLLKEASFLMKFFFLISFQATGNKKYQCMELILSQILLYSILYCCLQSASVTFYQIPASFAHCFICCNCAYDCKMFILVHKAMALKSVTFTLDVKQGLCAQKIDKGDEVG